MLQLQIRLYCGFFMSIVPTTTALAWYDVDDPSANTAPIDSQDPPIDAPGRNPPDNRGGGTGDMALPPPPGPFTDAQGEVRATLAFGVGCVASFGPQVGKVDVQRGY